MPHLCSGVVRIGGLERVSIMLVCKAAGFAYQAYTCSGGCFAVRMTTWPNIIFVLCLQAYAVMLPCLGCFIFVVLRVEGCSAWTDHARSGQVPMRPKHCAGTGKEVSLRVAARVHHVSGQKDRKRWCMHMAGYLCTVIIMSLSCCLPHGFPLQACMLISKLCNHLVVCKFSVARVTRASAWLGRCVCYRSVKEVQGISAARSSAASRRVW